MAPYLLIVLAVVVLAGAAYAHRLRRGSDPTATDRSDRTEETIRRLVEVSSRSYGETFFREMALELSSILRADYALIGELAPDGGDTIRTLAVTANGVLVDNISYALEDTPCADVVGREICTYRTGVADLFPRDVLLREMEVEGYVGVPLFDAEGVPLGIMVALYRSEVTDPEYAGTLMQVFSTRVGSELARMRSEAVQRRLEARVRQGEKMEALGTMAGGIAHDFNNILTGMFGSLTIARGHLDDPEKLNLDLDDLTRASVRARDLVRQILIFSRQVEPARTPHDAVALVREALGMVRASLPATIEIRATLDADGAVIMADESQIHQILVNLCVNAGHAMREVGGILQVSLVRIDDPDPDAADGTDRAGDWMEISVIDQGEGIPPETLDRIFDPFFTTKPRGEGTGLGLSTVHGIVADLGGTIRVDSEPGRGTSVRVCLPLTDERPGDGPRAPGDAPPATGRILYVEDDPMVARPIVRLLGRAGYVVTDCRGGDEALRIYGADPTMHDLVLTDLTMPGMTGLDLARSIRELDPDVPVVMATGHVHAIGPDLAREIGLHAVVEKPLLIDELRVVIEAALGRDDVS